MGYASRLGRARISASRPQAAGQCDMCGFVFTHSDLRFQYDYAGAGLVNRQKLVCRTCEDRPQMQLKAIVLAADPVPIKNPRPVDFASQRTDKRTTIGETIIDPVTGLSRRTGDQRATQDGDDRIVQPNGDEMLKPPFEVADRVTSTRGQDRATQEGGRRVTQLRPKVPPPPPRYFVKKTRVTNTGDVRVTMADDTRVTEPIEEK